MRDINLNNTCSVIVTYNPEASIVDNIRKIASFSYKVVVVDNASYNISSLLNTLKNEINNICIIENHSNLGIAKALNIGIKYALQFAPNWIFTFDQDSLPSDDFLSAYNIALSSLSVDKVGLLSCCFSDAPCPAPKNISVKKKHTIITSGCLHNTDIFSKVGFYNESLFIDCVDFDYSLRVAKAGFSTYRISQCLLLHHLGNPLYRKFLFWKISSTNHSLMRRYYMSRNHFYLSKVYFTSFPLYIIKKNIFFAFMILQLLFVETNRREKVLIMWKGFKDAFSFICL